MKHVLITSWVCPYCGHTNKMRRQTKSPYHPDREVTYCEIESGGCDRMVVVEFAVTISATAHKVLTPYNDSVRAARADADRQPPTPGAALVDNDDDPALAAYRHTKAQAQAYLAAERGEND